jgi:hypothetical protein
VNDVSIGLEHVDLLNCLDWLNIELLQGCLQLLVVHSGALVDLLDLSSGCTLSTIDALVSIFKPSTSSILQAVSLSLCSISESFGGRLITYPRRGHSMLALD